MLYCNVKKYIKTNICCLNQSEHEGTRYPCSECDHVAVQIQSLRQHIRVSPLSIQYIRAGEPAIFLSAPALDFFFKRNRLRLLVFFSELLRLRLLGKIFLSPETSKVKLQKKYKTSKMIVFLTKNYILLKEE